MDKGRYFGAYSFIAKESGQGLSGYPFLVYTVNQNKPIELSREDIAQYVGTATESLIRTLRDFKAEKLIEIKEGKIVIGNVEKLKNLLY